jgi:2'-5' RNA ligase
VERLSDTVNALKAPSIQASLGNVGFFPPRATPRVLFVDLRDGVAEVKNLYRTFHDLIRPLGYREQEREFVPHITIARNRGARSGRGRLERDQPVKIPPDWRSVGTMELLDGSFVINRLIIYASHLKPGGAEYVPLKQIPLL